MARSGEIDSTMEQPRPLSCLIRSVRDRANKWCVVSPPVGAAIARDPALRKLSCSGARDLGLVGSWRNGEGEDFGERVSVGAQVKSSLGGFGDTPVEGPEVSLQVLRVRCARSWF